MRSTTGRFTGGHTPPEGRVNMTKKRRSAADGRTVREVFWEERFNSLATYNSEVARGIVHTPEWIQKMADMQSDYNAKIQRRLD
ncbi:MAG TPA: hypothetical protein PK406_08180 [Verrucomicrobiota bacterium]|nr:hypothetical protein [Verrucomicrobiota bacterium]